MLAVTCGKHVGAPPTLCILLTCTLLTCRALYQLQLVKVSEVSGASIICPVCSHANMPLSLLVCVAGQEVYPGFAENRQPFWVSHVVLTLTKGGHA
jgi:hypothetical protein